MKKKVCLFVLLLFVFVSVFSASAETTPVAISNEIMEFMLETTLENGLNQHKDVQVLLNNAIQNGYDYCNVTYSDKTTSSFKIEIAVDGLCSSLLALKNADEEEFLLAKDTIVSHCLSIYDLCQAAGREDINIVFKILDDRQLFKYGIADSCFLYVFIKDGEVNRFVETLGIPTRMQ